MTVFLRTLRRNLLEISHAFRDYFPPINQITLDNSQLRLPSLRNLGNFVFMIHLAFQGI